MTSQPPLPEDPTARRCAECGETYSDSHHSHARRAPSGDDATLLAAKTATRAIESPELPPEVREAARDPKRLVNQYVLVQELGRGGMGTVHKAFDRKLLRWVAIKFLIADDEESIRRFTREAQLAARLRHPNIAPIYEVGEHEAPPSTTGSTFGEGTSGRRPFIAMEFIPGKSLDKARLPLHETVEIMAKVCAAVEAAHRSGVIHRDLKPQNIMLTDERWPYVMDFGLAKALTDSSLSASGQVLGTPAYMSPEQAEGQIDKIDARTDVYGLGATLYALATGRQPFSADSPLDTLVKVTRDDPVPPSSVNPEIPQRLQNIILKAMEKSRARRYASASELAEDLRRFLANEEILARTPGLMRVAVRRIGRHPWTVAGLLFLILLAGAAAIVVRARRPRPADVWFRQWREVREQLAFESFSKPDPASANRHLLQMKEALTPSDADLVAVWFNEQITHARAKANWPRNDWLNRQDDARRVIAWADAVKAAIARVDPLSALEPQLDSLRAAADQVVQYRGTARLRVFVWPWATAQRLTRLDGNAVPIGDGVTPLVFEELEVADYDLVLLVGQETRTIRITGLRNGETCTVIGRIDDPKSIRLLR